MDDLLMKSPEFIDRFLGKVASVHLTPDLFLIRPQPKPKLKKSFWFQACHYFEPILIFKGIRRRVRCTLRRILAMLRCARSFAAIDQEFNDGCRVVLKRAFKSIVAK